MKKIIALGLILFIMLGIGFADPAKEESKHKEIVYNPMKAHFESFGISLFPKKIKKENLNGKAENDLGLYTLREQENGVYEVYSYDLLGVHPVYFFFNTNTQKVYSRCSSKSGFTYEYPANKLASVYRLDTEQNETEFLLGVLRNQGKLSPNQTYETQAFYSKIQMDGQDLDQFEIFKDKQKIFKGYLDYYYHVLYDEKLEVLYENPLRKVEERNFESDVARGDGVLEILLKLGALKGEKKDYTVTCEKSGDTVFDIQSCYKVSVVEKKAPDKKEHIYLVEKDASIIGEYDPETDVYCLIYGIFRYYEE